MDLRHISIDKLKISTLNMRHERKKPEIGDILPSIRERGVLVPLIVRPNGAKGSFEILAGRRRFFASNAVLKETGDKTIKLPCAVLAEGDDAGAIEASILENVARLEPDEMSQFEAFQRLADEGRTVEQIALTFGVTELMVKRRLALANLLPEIRKAYAAEEIDGTTITALTLGSETQQREWFDLWNDDDAEYVPTGRQLKAWLLGGAYLDRQGPVRSGQVSRLCGTNSHRPLWRRSGLCRRRNVLEMPERGACREGRRPESKRLGRYRRARQRPVLRKMGSRHAIQEGRR